MLSLLRCAHPPGHAPLSRFPLVNPLSEAVRAFAWGWPNAVLPPIADLQESDGVAAARAPVAPTMASSPRLMSLFSSMFTHALQGGRAMQRCDVRRGGVSHAWRIQIVLALNPAVVTSVGAMVSSLASVATTLAICTLMICEQLHLPLQDVFATRLKPVNSALGGTPASSYAPLLRTLAYSDRRLPSVSNLMTSYMVMNGVWLEIRPGTFPTDLELPAIAGVKHKTRDGAICTAQTIQRLDFPDQTWQDSSELTAYRFKDADFVPQPSTGANQQLQFGSPLRPTSIATILFAFWMCSILILSWISFANFSWCLFLT